MPVLKNLENKIRLALIVCVVVTSGSAVISISALLTARGMVADSEKRIYVLSNGVPFTADQSTMEENWEIEAKNHVEMFHEYFFNLPPDDSYMRYTIKKALYLADESGLSQYKTLKERGFYNDILGTSSVFNIITDSIKVDRQKMEFTYYGRERIERRSAILWRSLVTTGNLREVPRSQNNPHGLLIVHWRTLKNQDIGEQQKQQY